MTELEKLIPVGAKLVSHGRTIFEGEFSLLSTLTWSTSEVHSNREVMRKTPYGDVVLAGHCTLALMGGLHGTSGLGAILYQDEIRSIGLVGIENVRIKYPLKPGDTMTVQTEILSVTPTKSDPNRSILRYRDTAHNQNGQLLIEAEFLQLMELSPK
jgi:acyl dehydratase